jgi:hypothetical protein
MSKNLFFFLPFIWIFFFLKKGEYPSSPIWLTVTEQFIQPFCIFFTPTLHSSLSWYWIYQGIYDKNGFLYRKISFYIRGSFLFLAFTTKRDDCFRSVEFPFMYFHTTKISLYGSCFVHFKMFLKKNGAYHYAEWRVLS